MISDDRDHRIKLDVMQMQLLEPAGEKMEDEEEIAGHENRVDGELDQERSQRLGFLLSSPKRGPSPTLRY